jgi:outer membrane protein
MYKLGVALLMLGGLLLAPLFAAQAADFKVGVVDGMDIISKSPEGKKVQDNLKRKSEELGRPFEAKRRDLAKMMADFQKQATVMKEDARKRKEEEINKRLEQFRKEGAQAEQQLARFQERELAPLFQKLEQAVKNVAQEGKLDLVLDKRNSGLLYITPSLDITEKVRSRFR